MQVSLDIVLERPINHHTVDELGNSAGEVALSLNDTESYELIRDAGLRSGAYPKFSQYSN